MNPHPKLTRVLDVAAQGLLATLVAGSILAFGGQVSWYPVFLSIACAALALVVLMGAIARRRVEAVRSPLGLLGLLVVGLGLIQCTPLPARLFASHSVRTVRTWDESSMEPGGTDRVPLVDGRVILTADRPATLRWTMAALACLVVFLVTSQSTSSLARFRFLAGALTVAFGICTVVGLLQLAAQAPGAYGLFSAERGPAWAPSGLERREGPGWTRLSPLRGGLGSEDSAWLMARPVPVFSVGPLVAGPGAYLALASLVLPFLAGLTLHRLAPRGSRESLVVRLRQSGGAPAVLLAGTIGLCGSVLVGLFGGLVIGAAILGGVSLACLLGMWGTGTTRAGILIFLTSFLGIIVGDGLGRRLGRPEGAPRIADSGGLSITVEVWDEARHIGTRFPVAGIGLGAFGAVHPQVKQTDEASTTALSSVVQWWAEAGGIGLLLVVFGAAWVLRKLPGAIRSVGPADRALPGALVGAVLGLALLSNVHWTIQLPAVSVAAAALAGAFNRWLAGATDLFVETLS